MPSRKHLSTSIKYRRFRKKYNSILCSVGKKLNFSRRVWCEQYEPKKSTLHSTHIIFSMTQIHRVRFVSEMERHREASTFFRIFFFKNQDQDHDQDQDFTMKFIWKSYSSYIKDTHQIWCRSTNFCENQNSVQDQDHNFTLDFNSRPTFHT